MQASTIYFDFDRTLLDTDGLKAEQARRIAKITYLSEEQVVEGMKKYIASLIDHLDFHPEEYANYLASLYSVPAGDVMKVYLADTSYFAGFVFPEVVEVLTQLQQRGVSLGIFSSAQYEYQLHKLKYSGVMQFFKHDSIIIHPRKLTPEIVTKVPNESLVIDDDLAVVQELQKSHLHVVPIWCNRKSADEASGIRTIHTLRELL